MKSSNGFAVIELIVVGLFVAAAGLVFFSQRHIVEVSGRDDARKTAINALYYSLEEVYYQQNASYPRTISASVLPTVDADLFKDPNGVKLGDGKSNYRYESYGCTDNKCRGYTLRASLENEADFVKTSRNN